tara:strand:- start:783 stop:1427 length:645 start_codon:yes stop_codon:yes gene_type:complete
MKNEDLPKIIPVFPLSNFIIFPKTTVPLNIFEPRYIEMINDVMKSNKFLGMIQPKVSKELGNKTPLLHNIGCMGKIVSFKEEDARFLIELKGLIRFKIIDEIQTNKKYRECKISFEDYKNDLGGRKDNLKFSDLEIIFKDLKTLFDRKGFIINWAALQKQSLDEIINALAMASPFSLEEKQILLETKDINLRKMKIAEILTTYTYDQYDNNTIQ